MTRVVETDRPPLGQLLRELIAQLGELFRKEAELAKVEITERLQEKARNATGAALGAGVLVLAAFALLLAVVAGATVLLQRFLPGDVAVWLGPLLVAALLGAGGWLLLRAGLRRLEKTALAPAETVATLEETGRWLRAKVG